MRRLRREALDQEAGGRREVFGPLQITTFPLAGAARAHQAIADRTILGSGVLLP